MQAEIQIRAIEKKIMELLEGHPTHFLVEVWIKPTNNIKVFIDADEGMVLSQLIQYNRRIYKWLEESGWYQDGNFSLEVSSPGLDEPLKLKRQYKKNIGRYMDILLSDGSRREGKLIEANDEGIVIESETGKGKKKQVFSEAILLDSIKSAKIQAKF